MDDLISRQAALNAMCDNCGTVEAICPYYPCARYEAVEELPSAQPDVHDRNVGKWDMFDLITSAYYGKMMYSKQDNGIVYSRYSCKYMSMDEAIMEFLALIGEDIE